MSKIKIQRSIMVVMALFVAVALIACSTVSSTSLQSTATQQSTGGSSSGTAQQTTAAVGTSASNTTAHAVSTSAAKTETIVYEIYRNIGDPIYPAEDGGKARTEILKSVEAYGIKGFDYQIVLTPKVGAEYYTKLNTRAATGDLPDLFEVDQITMARFVDEGLLLKIDDYFNLMPKVLRTYKNDEQEQIRYHDGVYALPQGSRPEVFTTPNVNGLVIRADWLANLGLSMPQTIDEVHNVLTAFTKNDPDKNGADDTFGFATDKDGISGNKKGNFAGFFGAYGIIPLQWKNLDGRLKQGAVLPEAKTVLGILREWYSEGIIDPEYPIMEEKQIQEKMVNSKIGVWETTCYRINYASPFGQAIKKSNPGVDLQIVPAPSGPNGLRGYESILNTSGMRAISAKTKRPETLIEVLNWCADDDPVKGGFYLTAYGIEGEQWTLDKEKNQIILPPSNTSANAIHPGFGNVVKFFATADARWMFDETRSAAAMTSKNNIPNAFSGLVPAMTEYPDIDKLWLEYSTKIITGVMPLDAWDEYVAKYYRQGGQELEDQVNSASK